MIAQVAAFGLNLTKLESRPIPNTDFEFMFYLDIEGSLLDPKVRCYIESLHESLTYMEFLGNYRDLR